ncbi:MAG: hypothetical protein DDT39_00008 [Firmicutes bacterium]|nr:hypothetical protein [candidate division NPL-UPA2 bacterium]
MLNGLVMFISLLFLASWIPAHWKRRAVGFGLWTDVGIHVLLQTLFGGDADGRIAMLFAGVLMNMAMHTYRYFLGYETMLWSKMIWVRHPGRLTQLH